MAQLNELGRFLIGLATEITNNVTGGCKRLGNISLLNYQNCLLL